MPLTLTPSTIRFAHRIVPLVEVVLGSVLLVTSPPLLEVDAKPFLRDLFMYILCTSGIFFFCLDGVVTQLEALGFIVAYVTYIVIVLISPNPSREPSPDRDSTAAGLLSNESYESLKDVESLQSPPSDTDSHAERPSRQFSYASHHAHHTNLLAAYDDHILGYNDTPMVEEDGKLAVFLWYAEWPLSLLRHLSIPSADPFWCRKRRLFTSLSPILGLQMAILAVFGVKGEDGRKEQKWYRETRRSDDKNPLKATLACNL